MKAKAMSSVRMRATTPALSNCNDLVRSAWPPISRRNARCLKQARELIYKELYHHMLLTKAAKAERQKEPFVWASAYDTLERAWY